MINKIKLIKKDGIVLEETYADIRFLSEYDLEKILELQKLIVDGLSNPELFQPDTEAFIRNHITQTGRIIGCFTDDRLIAYAVMTKPGKNANNLGYDLAFEESELCKVVHFESVVVSPHYRGNRLQYSLESIVEEIAKDEGFKHICSTVSPLNKHSLNNVLQLGFEEKLEKNKYGGKLRKIFYKKI